MSEDVPQNAEGGRQSSQLHPTSQKEEQNPEILAMKLRLAELKRKKLELVRRYGLHYYKPHAVQDKFHRAGTQFKRRMVRAGNRLGKSHMGCAEDCAWIFGERVWYPEGDPARRGGIPQHPVKLLTITTDWDKVDEIWTGEKGEGGKVWKMLPRDRCKVRRNHSGAIDTIEADINDRKSVWRFDTVKSFMSNPLGSESSDWDGIHVDEPCPEDMFKASARGLIDRGGSAWFTLTPLTEFWINDYFFPQDTGGKIRGGVWAITASIYDNPYLTKEAIAEFEALLTDDEKQCRLLGIPLHLAGLIYKEFQWDAHVLKELPEGWVDWITPPKNWPRYFAIDPHPQTPHCVLFATVTPGGRRIYYHDLFLHCSIWELAEKIHGVHRDCRPVWGKMDPLGFIDDPITKTNMAIELERSGVFVEKATKALEQGILRVQGELKKRSKVDGQPPIGFTPSCRRALWEIQRYCWDEKENKPIDKDDHAMENLYRLELSDMLWIDRTATPAPAIGEIEITQPLLDLPDLSLTL
jgi:hypothetical protein